MNSSDAPAMCATGSLHGYQPSSSRTSSRTVSPTASFSRSPSGLLTATTGVPGFVARFPVVGVPQIDVQIPQWMFSPGLMKTCPAAPAASKAETMPGIANPSLSTILPATSGRSSPSRFANRSRCPVAAAAGTKTSSPSSPPSAVGAAKDGGLARIDPPLHFTEDSRGSER